MIIVKSQNDLVVVCPKDIMYCLADGSYTHIYLKDNRKLLVSKALNHIQDQLSEKFFVRLHRSHLVNLTFVKSFANHTTNVVKMENGEELKVSMDRRKELLKHFIII